jgi:hypothetical protein
VEVQFALQLKVPGLAMHCAMQLAPQEPVHIALPVAVHWPSHSAATLTGVHSAVHPPVTTNEQVLGSAVKWQTWRHGEEAIA